MSPPERATIGCVAKALTKIGMISDTHGLLRDEAVRALKGSELIIHAGDVGAPEIIEALSKIAPVVAVKGNVDNDPWASALPATGATDTGFALIYVVHNIHDLDLDLAVAGFQIVVSGHSHQPSRAERDGVLYLNPGSAGPRRLTLPVTIARLDLSCVPWKVDWIDLLQSGK
jgi:putative phosphoesterase